MITVTAISIITLYSLTNLCEAWLEEIVIELKNTHLSYYNSLNRKEHSRSLILAILIMVPYIAISIYFSMGWLIPAILVNRRMFFDFPLTILRGRPRAIYEGTDTFGRILSRVFGKRGRLRELLVTLAITLGSLYMTIKFGQ